MLYAGLEQSFWMSWNGGADWQRIGAGLPPASVRDIRVQPDSHDLILATHGRGIWILDDARPLAQLAQLDRPALLPVRTAYLFNRHQDTFNLLAPGANPPAGALITIYQPTAAGAAPQMDVVDDRGRIVRRITVQNAAGLQRVAWRLCVDPPQPWRSAPEWNRGEECGAFTPPGTYRVRLRIAGRTLERRVVVRGAPFFNYTCADYRARHALAVQLFAIYDGIDGELNALDAWRARAGAAGAIRARIDALLGQLSANPQNSQDDDFLQDMLRERVQGLLSTIDGAYSRPTAAQYAQAAAIAARYRELTREFQQVRGAVSRL